jgi:hypothetical protein
VLVLLIIAYLGAVLGSLSAETRYSAASHGVTVALCCITCVFPTLLLPLLPFIQLVVVFGGVAADSVFDDFFAGTTVLKATLWFTLIVHMARFPLRVVRYSLICFIITLVVISAVRVDSRRTLDTFAMDAVLFAVLILLVHSSAALEQQDRSQKLQERYQLRKAAMLSEQLLRTVLPDDVARQLLRSVPPEQLTRLYDDTSIAFINLESEFYREIVSRHDPVNIILPLDAIWSLFDDVLEKSPYR